MAKIYNLYFNKIVGKLGNAIFQGKKSTNIIVSRKFRRRTGRHEIQEFNRYKYKLAIYHKNKLGTNSKKIYSELVEKDTETWWNELVRRIEKTLIGNEKLVLFFDELQGNTVYNIIDDGNHGVICGATWKKDSFGLIFDGIDDYILLNKVTPEEITVCAWVKPYSTDNYHEIVSQFSIFPEGSYFLRIDHPNEGGRFSFFIFDGQTAEPRASSVTIPEPYKLYFVAGTYDGKYVKIFVNGELEDTKEKTKPIDYTGAGDLVIGSTRWLYNFFKGEILEVRIYDRALSDKEIKYLYETTKKYIR